MPQPPILLGTYEPYSVGEQQHAPFFLDPSQHTYVIGASGSGKTHLLRNILIQMIARGDGVGFCDPHGDLSGTNSRDRAHRARGGSSLDAS